MKFAAAPATVRPERARVAAMRMLRATLTGRLQLMGGRGPEPMPWLLRPERLVLDLGDAVEASPGGRLVRCCDVGKNGHQRTRSGESVLEVQKNPANMRARVRSPGGGAGCCGWRREMR